RPRRFGSVCALEQRGNWNAENGSNLDEAPRSDAIGAHLVFLHLLKRDAEPFGELRLRQPLGHTPDAHIWPDDHVEGARALGAPFAHHARPPRCRTWARIRKQGFQDRAARTIVRRRTRPPSSQISMERALPLSRLFGPGTVLVPTSENKGHCMTDQLGKSRPAGSKLATGRRELR